MQTTMAVCQAAPPDAIRAEHLPALPPWWPADPTPTEDNPAPRPLSDAERATARQQLAMAEARRGPNDGERGQVVYAAEPPPLLRFGAEGGWAYRLSEAESQPGRAVYRYSPADSPAHRATMAAVEQAYLEVGGPGYVHGARTDEAEHQGVTAERIDR